MRWHIQSRKTAACPTPSRKPGHSEWYKTTQAEDFGIELAEAEAIVTAIERRYLGAKAKAGERRKFRQRLHLSDLMLARGCARGHALAWETLWQRYRQRLHAAARGLTGEPSRAAELADSLFADLYGLRERRGQRVSKLESYTAIGSLEGWMCALLAQANVDQWRRERRLVELDENEQLLKVLAAPPSGAGWNPPSANQDLEAVGRIPQRQIEAALEAVLAEVDGAGRLLLSLYFLDGRTLAQIGALWSVHESTVSRRLDRLLRQLRRQTRRELGRQGVPARARDEILRLDPRWLQVDVRKLLQPATTSRNPGGMKSV